MYSFISWAIIFDEADVDEPVSRLSAIHDTAARIITLKRFLKKKERRRRSLISSWYTVPRSNSCCIWKNEKGKLFMSNFESNGNYFA